MEKTYTSRYGKIVKKCPGLPEYWYKGKLVARGSSVTESQDPEYPPTKSDWQFCASLRDSSGDEQRSTTPEV